MIFGEFATLKENYFLLDNTILLFLFKEVLIIFSCTILSKNLLKLQILKERSTNFVDKLKYTESSKNLDKIYAEKTNGIGISSKCDWYEDGEKSSKVFLNLEKPRAVQNLIRNIL